MIAGERGLGNRMNDMTLLEALELAKERVLTDKRREQLKKIKGVKWSCAEAIVKEDDLRRALHVLADALNKNERNKLWP